VIVAAILSLAQTDVASPAGCEARYDVSVRGAVGRAPELQIRVGPIIRARILVLDGEGRLLGTAAAFPPGVPFTASLPVPPSAIRDGHLPLRIRIREQGGRTRAPVAGEILGLTVVTGTGSP